jgi:hypothetical protein
MLYFSFSKISIFWHYGTTGTHHHGSTTTYYYYHHYRYYHWYYWNHYHFYYHFHGITITVTRFLSLATNNQR